MFDLSPGAVSAVKTDALRQPPGSSRIMPGLKTVLSFDDIVKE